MTPFCVLAVIHKPCCVSIFWVFDTQKGIAADSADHILPNFDALYFVTMLNIPRHNKAL